MGCLLAKPECRQGSTFRTLTKGSGLLQRDPKSS